MKVFVTGASGLIGSRLCERLINRGDEVLALSRTARPGKQGITWITGSTEDASGWQSAIDGCDAVVNLAGENVGQRWGSKKRQLIVESRISITKRLVEAVGLAEHKPKVFVSTSAVGYYGTDLTETFDEHSPNGTGFLADLCKQWEEAAHAVQAHGVRLAIVRVGVVLSKDGGALPKIAAPIRAFVGGPLGNGRQWMSWIHIDDIVNLFIHAIDHEQAEGVINGVAPEPLTNADLTQAVAKTLKRPAWLAAPGFALRAGLGEMANEMLLSGQRVTSKEMEQWGFVCGYDNVERALSAIYAG